VSAKARPSYVLLYEGHYVPLLEELELGKSLPKYWFCEYLCRRGNALRMLSAAGIPLLADEWVQCKKLVAELVS